MVGYPIIFLLFHLCSLFSLYYYLSGLVYLPVLAAAAAATTITNRRRTTLCKGFFYDGFRKHTFRSPSVIHCCQPTNTARDNALDDSNLKTHFSN